MNTQFLLDPARGELYRRALLVGVLLTGVIAGLIVLSSQEAADFLREGPARLTGLEGSTLRVVLGVGTLVATVLAVVALWPRAGIGNVVAGAAAIGRGAVPDPRPDDARRRTLRRRRRDRGRHAHPPRAIAPRRPAQLPRRLGDRGGGGCGGAHRAGLAHGVARTAILRRGRDAERRSGLHDRRRGRRGGGRRDIDGDAIRRGPRGTRRRRRRRCRGHQRRARRAVGRRG